MKSIFDPKQDVPNEQLWRSAILNGNGSPVGVQTPVFEGQEYIEDDATPKQIWKANGLTNSDWQLIGDFLPVAWANYADTQYTTGARLTITGGVRTKLPNNALSTINTYMPVGLDFYDSVTQKITPSGLGETYELRINFKSESASINNYSTLELDIGGGQGVILERTVDYPRGASVEHGFSSTSSIFALGTFLANGGEIYMNPDSNIEVWDISYTIIRNSASNIDVGEAPVDGRPYGRRNGVWFDITTPSLQSEVSIASLALDIDSFQEAKITAQAVGLTIANPTGTPSPNQMIAYSIVDDGTPQTISFGAQFKGLGVTLPATTTVGNIIYLIAKWNVENSKWYVLGYNNDTI